MSEITVELVDPEAEIVVGVTEVVVDVGVIVPADVVASEGGVQLGETSSTAYRGDRGKTAFDHTSLTNNPHSVTAAQVGADPAGSAAAAQAHAVQRSNHTGSQAISTVTGLQTALDGKAATSHAHAQSDITNLVTDLAAKATQSYVDAIDAQVQALLGDRIWTVVKQADETRTVTTQANDGEMAMPLPANSVCRVDVSYLVSGGTAADIDIDLDIGTATLGSSGVRGHVQGWSGASFANITNPPPITPGTPVWVGTGTTQDAEIVVWAVLTTTTATTVRPKWAQHVATGSTTVRKGSYITARI